MFFTVIAITQLKFHKSMLQSFHGHFQPSIWLDFWVGKHFGFPLLQFEPWGHLSAMQLLAHPFLVPWEEEEEIKGKRKATWVKESLLEQHKEREKTTGTTIIERYAMHCLLPLWSCQAKLLEIARPLWLAPPCIYLALC